VFGKGEGKVALPVCGPGGYSAAIGGSGPGLSSGGLIYTRYLCLIRLVGIGGFANLGRSDVSLL